MTNVCVPTPEQSESLMRWRALALQLMPYYSSMLFSLTALNAPGTGTFAVDGKHRLYVDFEAVEHYGDRWCAEALLHECGHLFYTHAERSKSVGATSAHQKMLANYAGDAEINDDLVEAGCASIEGTLTHDGKPCPGGVLAPSFDMPNFETFETYYQHLAKTIPDTGAQASGGCGSGSGGQPLPCELGDDDLGGKAGGLSDLESTVAVTSTAAEIQQAASQGRGTVPAGLQAQAGFVLAPAKIPWRNVLRVLVKRASQTRAGDEDTSYSKRNRRFSSYVNPDGDKVIFPGPIGFEPRGVVIRDTSGSVGDDLLNLASNEVVGIARQLHITGDSLLVVDVDADIQHVSGFKNAGKLATRHGYGGTDMRVGIEWAASLRPKPNFCVVLTDGETPWPEVRPQGMTVVACLLGHPGHRSRARKYIPSWISVVEVDDHA